jgi:hypothetical protein
MQKLTNIIKIFEEEILYVKYLKKIKIIKIPQIMNFIYFFVEEE